MRDRRGASTHHPVTALAATPLRFDRPKRGGRPAACLCSARRRMRIALPLTALALVACGASAPPTYQLGQSQAAVRAAEELGADDSPQASLHLKMARDHLANAERLMAAEQYDDAGMVLKRAEADAELAVVLAREADERIRAENALRKVQVLRQELR